MIIGIPKEIKPDENRIALPPSHVHDLVQHGHQVMIETGAGLGSGFTDEEFETVGASISPTAADTWNKAEMVIKVKEPIAPEYGYLRSDLILFTYLHLAADEPLTRAMCESGVAGIAYETVEDRNGHLPLLEPMSVVAGRMASQVVATLLERHHGGRGVLMGGVPGVPPANIVVLGGGTVGTNAAKVALGMGANVTIVDINQDRLRYLEDVLHGRLQTLYSSRSNILDAIATADAVIGAVLIPGARAPKLITRDMLAAMQPNSVIVDVAVDQGGCIETTRVTTHHDPTYYVDGILHYGVANMPGAVPRTSSMALANATHRYGIKLANQGLQAITKDAGLCKGVNTLHGTVTYQAVAEAFGMEYRSVETAMHQSRTA